MKFRNKPKLTLFILLFGTLQFSCNKHSAIENIPVSEVVRDKYTDYISVPGIIESTSTLFIDCPEFGMDVTIEYLIPDGTFVKVGDTICRLEASALKIDYESSLQNVEQYQAEYNKMKADLELQELMLQANVQTIETTTEIIKLDSIQKKFTTPINRQIIELRLEQADIEKQKILNQLSFLKRINEAELRKMKLRITQQEIRVKTMKEKFDKLILTSTVDGLVLRSPSSTSGLPVNEGDVIWGGLRLVNIPNMTSLLIKLQLSEASYKRIEQDQKVMIDVDALAGVSMTGKVKFKEPMGQPVERNSKVKIFNATVSIDSIVGNIRPGISTTCKVILNEIQDTLLLPYISVFEDDSSKFVYVKKNNHFEKRNIELTYYNNNIGIVKSGVFENEKVTLIKPPENLIK